MFPFLPLLLAASSLLHPQLRAGELLHVRLIQPVGSFASRPGAPVRAVLIAPVTEGSEILLEAGSVLSGTIKSVRRVGLGIVHETAALDLDFNRIAPPEAAAFPISTRVEQVDNGREHVAPDGRIEGVRVTSSLSYRASGYIRTLLLWDVHAEAAEWLIKSLIVQIPEPEIYYPPGAELTLEVSEPVRTTLLAGASAGRWPRQLSRQEHVSVAETVAALPFQTTAPNSNRPADLINVMFAGSRQQLDSAFAAAGWREARPKNLRSGIKGIRAVAEERGFVSAPMSTLLLNDEEAEVSWEKGLNDLAKRHHVRVWKEPETWNGRQVWIGAATQDIDFAYMRPGHLLTHKVAEDIDDERDKIGNDLAFAGCLDAMDWQNRPHVPLTSHNATGDRMNTDGRLAILELKTCAAPRISVKPYADPLPARGGNLQRILRRQIMSVRSDLIRDNLYWRSYESIRWMISAVRKKRHSGEEPPATQARARRLPSGDLGLVSLY